MRFKKDKTEIYIQFHEACEKKHGHTKISRSQAIADGFLFYYGGRCSFGHEPYRYVSNRACRICVMEKNALKKLGIDSEDFSKSVKLRRSIEDRLFDLELKRINGY